jgi:putative RecB family exonuclease
VSTADLPVTDLNLAADERVAEEREPRVDGEGPKHFSPSSAGTFRQCQRRWQYRYIEHRPDPPGIPALVGTFVHRILEELLDMPTPDRNLDVAKKLARDIWPEVQEHDAYIAMRLEEEADRGVRWRAWRLIEAYFAMENPAEVEVVQREQRVECDLDGVPFVGIVDRVERTDDKLVVTDYKTGRAPTERYKNDRLRQVLLYAAALDAVDQRPHSARLMYIGSGSIEADVTEDAMAEVRSELATTWSAVGAAVSCGEFPTTVGPLCNWCPYAADCPDGQAEIERRYGPAA